MNPEYKNREKTDFKILRNNNRYTLTNLLKNEYPYILQAMKYEQYKIEYKDYDILQELIYENKVVGIITLEIIDQPIRTLCINEVYILQEYRHKGIFHETLLNLLTQPNINIAIKNPNRKIIDLLINYKLAKKLKNNLVLSYIDFNIEDSMIYTNKQIKSIYDTNYINETIATDFYDLNINSCVFMEINDINDHKKNKAFIVKARLSDSKKDKYYNLLRNIDLIYLENLKERILHINEEEIEFLQNVQKRIDEFLDINDILGTENELTPIFKEKLHEYNLSEKDGFNIRSKVLKSLKNNEIIPRSMVIRTIYLLENYNEPRFLNENYYHSNIIKEKCPYCSHTLFGMEEVCTKCGYNLLKDSDNNNLLEKLTDEIIFNTSLSPRLILKEEKNKKQNKLTNILKEELEYLDYDEEEVYIKQSIISTYQFLKNINDMFYFEVYNYDLLNNIQEGSAFQFALNNQLITKLTNYQYYLKLMEEVYPERYLRKILEENNYSISGEKDELIERIERNINPRDIFGEKYVLTSKGDEFITNKDYLENYLENLSEFTFYEYQEFYDENKYKNFEQLNDAFIKYMNKIALSTGNYYKYHDVIRHKINSRDITPNDFLINFTLLFIIDINYWIISQEHRKTNKPLSNNVLGEFPEVKTLYYQSDVDEIFDKAMNSIELDELRDNEELVRFYLKKSLEYNDIDDINREIEYNIFKEEYYRRYSL